MLPRTLSPTRSWPLRALSVAALTIPSICSANVFNGGSGVRTFANPSVANLATGGFFSQPLGDNIVLSNVPSSSHSSTLPQIFSRTDTYDLGFDFNTNSEVIAQIPWTASMNASASATSAPGVLHLFASARATLSPPTVSVLDGSGTPTLLSNSLKPWASGEVSAETQDTLTVTSATLPPGTPVDLRSNLNIHASLSADPDGAYDITVYLQAGHKNVGPMANTDPNAPNPNDFSFYQHILRSDSTRLDNDYPTAIIHTFVGDQLTFDLTALAHASAPVNFITPDNPDISATVDMSNTIFLNLDSLTPGASFTTLTGTNYFTQAPEPASLTLLAIAATGTLRRNRRRA